MVYDIHEACLVLGTTSRTLRYYEEQGLIACERDPFSSRRRFTDEQMECARNVLTLRTLGLSLKSIHALQKQDITLKEAVLLRRAEIEACIKQKYHELSRLNEALYRLESDSTPLPPIASSHLDKLDAIADRCFEAIRKEDSAALYSYVTPKLASYCPEAIYRNIWRDIVAPLGRFVKYENRWWDDILPNTVYQQLRFEKMGLCVKLVFCGDRIDGIWMNYDKQEDEI